MSSREGHRRQRELSRQTARERGRRRPPTSLQHGHVGLTHPEASGKLPLRQTSPRPGRTHVRHNREYNILRYPSRVLTTALHSAEHPQAPSPNLHPPCPTRREEVRSRALATVEDFLTLDVRVGTIVPRSCRGRPQARLRPPRRFRRPRPRLAAPRSPTSTSRGPGGAAGGGGGELAAQAGGGHRLRGPGARGRRQGREVLLIPERPVPDGAGELMAELMDAARVARPWRAWPTRSWSATPTCERRPRRRAHPRRAPGPAPGAARRAGERRRAAGGRARHHALPRRPHDHRRPAR